MGTIRDGPPDDGTPPVTHPPTPPAVQPDAATLATARPDAGTPPPAMRSTPDRIRHAILFEIVGLMFLVGGGWLLTGFDAHALGVIGIVSSVVATAWNYLYNLGFDHLLLRLRVTVAKTHAIRAVHAVLFEAGLLVILLPFVAWMLGVGLRRAFLFDLGVAGFYVVYGYLFNWAYDRAFPLSGGARPGQ